jgi:rare lipoprotein A
MILPNGLKNPIVVRNIAYGIQTKKKDKYSIPFGYIFLGILAFILQRLSLKFSKRKIRMFFRRNYLNIFFFLLILLCVFSILVGMIFAKEVEEETKEAKIEAIEEVKEIKKPEKIAVASWYDRSVCVGREYGINCLTANGEVFNDSELTFAHKTMKFGTEVEFSYNGNKVVCRANDRGPFVYGRDFDLSKGCFEKLTNLSKGVIKINYNEL